MRCERGQASIEWVAVLALVAAVFAVAVAIKADVAASTANRLTGAVRLALCAVTGQTCADVVLQPCTVRENGKEATVSAQVLFVRAGARGAITRVVRSDGTIEVTFVEGLEPGVGLALGAQGYVSAGRRRYGAAAFTAAEVRALGERARTWAVPDEQAAAALERKLLEVATGRGASAVAGTLPGIGSAVAAVQELVDRGQGVDLPAPTSTTLRGGLTAEAGAAGRTPLWGAKLTGELKLARVLGWTRDHKTGGQVVSLELGQDLAVELGVVAGAGWSRAVLRVGVDRDGRPATLETTIALEGQGRLDGAAIAGRLGLPQAVGDRVKAALAGGGAAAEATARLDLTAPVNAELVGRLLDAMRGGHAGIAAAAVRTLATRLVADGGLDVQLFGADRATYGGGATVAAGVKAGIDAEVVTSTRMLQGAWSRPAGGVWEQRADCLPA